MERIMSHFLTGDGIFEDVKLALSETDGDTFAAFVDDEEGHDFFANRIFNLAGNGHALFAKNAAALDDGEMICGEAPFPNLLNLEVDLGEDSILGVALDALAGHGAVEDQLGLRGELFDGEGNALARFKWEEGQEQTCREDIKRFNSHIRAKKTAGSMPKLKWEWGIAYA